MSTVNSKGTNEFKLVSIYTLYIMYVYNNIIEIYIIYIS